jgi:NADPH-dependent curcumin reductase CurA
VLKSGNSKWVEGDLFGAHLPFTTVQLLTGATLAKTLIWKLTDLIGEDQISLSIGILGMPGATAYGGLTDVLRPNKGETIFISAASGAVGGLVGQMSKQIYGCKVIGSCGGEEKCVLVKETFGYDGAIDYKQTADAAGLVAKVKELAPDGIDMYFENVGGMHFEAAMELLRPRGRVAICGQISEYNNATPQLCAFNPLKMIYTNQRIEGFVSTRWLSGQEGNFLRDMHLWLSEGKLKPKETFFEGIEQWPLAFQSLFTGTNVGKVVIRVIDC